MEVIVFGHPKLRSGLINELGKHFSSVSSKVRNLGVILNSELYLTKQINTVVKNSFYQLRIISRLKSFLSFNGPEKVIHVFITSCLDYCNSLYLGLHSSIACLQMVQNAVARLLTRAKKTDHITPILASLHWLPVHSRIQFKMLLFVFKALNGQAPFYLTDHLALLSSSRSLRSSDRVFLAVPRSRLKTNGDRAFSIAVPHLWNQLPLDISKTKELIVDFRKRQQRPYTPLMISGTPVERVSSFKYLGVNISEDLTWTTHIQTQVKKVRQRLYHLRQLRKFRVSPAILNTFYSGAIESVLTQCISVWYGNSSNQDCKALQRVVRLAERISGSALPSLQDIYLKRCKSRAAKIIKKLNSPR